MFRGVRECCLQHGLNFYDVRPLEVMMKPLPSPINLFNNLQGLANKIDYRITKLSVITWANIPSF